ncbi:putative transcription factor GRAS family [Helianthus annuus]|nr:putative transcription factor GRAS family [Helianthus annuus]
MAGQHFIDASSKVDEISNPSHPLPVSSSGLSDDEAKDIDLLLTLLASADKTGQRQFDEANELVELCSKTSSNEGTPVERLVYYFSEAIREKINRETGREASGGLERMRVFDFQKALMSVDASILAFHQKVPLSQVCNALLGVGVVITHHSLTTIPIKFHHIINHYSITRDGF